MKKALNLIERPVDRILISINESLRSFTHEAWQYASQITNGSSVFVLGFLYKPSFENYIKQKKRIKQIEPSSPFHGISPFANIVSKDDIDSDNIENNENNNDIHNRYHNNSKTLRHSVSEPSLNHYLRKDWDNLHNFVPDDVSGVKTTGLFEDIHLLQITIINFIMSKIRWLWHSIVSIINRFSVLSLFSVKMLLLPFYLLFLFWHFICELFRLIKLPISWLFHLIFHPSEVLSQRGMDTRSKEEIVRDSGYPYELHTVTTEDGYIITLERLPNPNSTKAIYFQHGVIDSGFTWLASGNSTSLAMAAYDKGYDIFLGNFRGNQPTSHINSKISSAKYWDFNVNDHAWKDIPAFVNYIHALKERELKYEDYESIELSMVAHSMGGMATLMYIIKCGLDNIPHRLSKAVLLSPAGIHRDSPPLATFGAPLLDLLLKFVPFIHSLQFPSNFVRLLSAKILEDLKSTNPTKDLFTYIATMLIGGSMEDHSLNRVNTVRWIFTGTPVGVFRHFSQLISSKEFRAFDYGKKRNLKEYGTQKPICFKEHYDKLDIPIYYMMGLVDNLIRPANVIEHYHTHAKIHPEMAYLRAFADAGHVEFTLGVSEEMTNVILSSLDEESKDTTPSVTFHSVKSSINPEENINI